MEILCDSDKTRKTMAGCDLIIIVLMSQSKAMGEAMTN